MGGEHGSREKKQRHGGGEPGGVQEYAGTGKMWALTENP